MSSNSHYKIVKECTDSSMHLTDCDRDGFCNICGYQETVDDLKPKFYQAKLVELNDEELSKELRGCSLEERLATNGECPQCKDNKWWLFPKEGIAVREGGKSYIECLFCGYQSHL